VTQLDASNPKPAGRKRKRATAFVPYKNQRTEDDWNPTREELLHIAGSSTPYIPRRTFRRSPRESSAWSAQMINAHFASLFAPSASPSPTRTRSSSTPNRYRPNSQRNSQPTNSIPPLRPHSNPNSPAFHVFNSPFPHVSPPSQPTPSRPLPRTRARTPSSRRSETVVIDLTSDGEADG